jgi:hypothetical protein
MYMFCGFTDRDRYCFPLTGKPLPPLTPEFTFTTGVPPPSTSGEQFVALTSSLYL